MDLHISQDESALVNVLQEHCVIKEVIKNRKNSSSKTLI